MLIQVHAPVTTLYVSYLKLASSFWLLASRVILRCGEWCLQVWASHIRPTLLNVQGGKDSSSASLEMTHIL